MSIENSLKRIADSLEILAGVADNMAADAGLGSAAAKIPLPDPKVDAPKAAGDFPEQTMESPVTKPVPVPAPVEKKVVVPAPAPATEPVVQMTLPELDAALLVEYNRLNKDRTFIDGVIKGYGVNTATELAPADYQAVLDAVKAL
jgi:hypothetical protein